MKLAPNTNILTREKVFPLLIEASPQFESIWQEFYEDFKDDREGIPYYVCLGYFASYLVEKLESGNTADFPNIFQVVERLHIEGDYYVSEAATIGLLEGIQNIAGPYANQFLPYLLPETKKWWKKLNDFWEKGIPF